MVLQPTKPGTYQAVAEYDLAKIAAGDYPKIEAGPTQPEPEPEPEPEPDLVVKG